MSADRYGEWDASYVLGALAPVERAEFEAHLECCAECLTRVAELSGLPALMADVPASAFEVADPPPPQGLLLSLQREVRRSRARRRGYYAAVSAAAAAVLIAATALVIRHDSMSTPQATATTRPMINLGTAPLHVDAAVASVAWGTRIDLKCTYDPSLSTSDNYRYWLVIVDRSGVAHEAGSWSATPGLVTTFTGGTSLTAAEISSVEVTLQNGTPLLSLRP